MEVYCLKLSNNEEVIGEFEFRTDTIIRLRNPCIIEWKFNSAGNEVMNLITYNLYTDMEIIPFYVNNIVSKYIVHKELEDYYTRFLILYAATKDKLKQQIIGSTVYLDSLIAKMNTLESDIKEPEVEAVPEDNEIDDDQYYKWALEHLIPPTDSKN
ncbi:MAG: hypothetical protein P4L79_10980 [Legionella sp.]|uniref:hypothetical protein n=1 Tax=Legionella sp. TaxID=459 RepID=UPI00284D8B7E|nr:hypothetical protein [Legionella sp.]